MTKKLNITIDHDLTQKLHSKFCLWYNSSKQSDGKKFWGYNWLTETEPVIQ